MKAPILTLVTALLLSSLGSADIIEEGGAIVYGSDYAFGLKAPKGWVLDNQSGLKQGIHAVFYPKGSNWKDSPVVIYARSRPKTENIVTAADAAKFVVEEFHANGSPKYQAKRIKTLKTDSGREVVIYHFSGDQWGNSETVAYYVEGKTINFVVMSSRDPKLFADSLEPFEALVKSYIFITDHVDAVSAVTEPATEKMTIEGYFLLLPRDSFEGSPESVITFPHYSSKTNQAAWLMFMKQPKCGLIDVHNGYMSCTGDEAQAPFEVALFRFRDGSPLLAVCWGDHSEEGMEHPRDGLVFLDFFRLGADKKMHKVSRSIFPVGDAGNRKENWRFELPRYGRTVLVRSQKNGDILHKLTWNGEKFVEKW